MNVGATFCTVRFSSFRCPSNGIGRSGKGDVTRTRRGRYESKQDRPVADNQICHVLEEVYPGYDGSGRATGRDGDTHAREHKNSPAVR